MEKEVIVSLNKNFAQAAFEREGVEFWFARDIQVLLEYAEWRNFSQVIEKAKMACQNSGQTVGDHFVDVNKMVKLGQHVKNNRDVRNLLAKSGIKPESLPAEEDIKKLERRVKADDKKMIVQVKKKGK